MENQNQQNEPQGFQPIGGLMKNLAQKLTDKESKTLLDLSTVSSTTGQEKESQKQTGTQLSETGAGKNGINLDNAAQVHHASLSRITNAASWILNVGLKQQNAYGITSSGTFDKIGSSYGIEASQGTKDELKRLNTRADIAEIGRELLDLSKHRQNRQHRGGIDSFLATLSGDILSLQAGIISVKAAFQILRREPESQWFPSFLEIKSVIMRVENAINAENREKKEKQPEKPIHWKDVPESKRTADHWKQAVDDAKGMIALAEKSNGIIKLADWQAILAEREEKLKTAIA